MIKKSAIVLAMMKPGVFDTIESEIEIPITNDNLHSDYQR